MADQRDSHSVSLLGVRLDPRTMDELHAEIESAVSNGVRLTIASQNLHGVYMYHRSEPMRRFQEHALVRIDGMALIFIGKVLGLPLRRSHRLTWVDWLHPLMGLAASKGWRVYFVGGEPDVAQRAKDALIAIHPLLRIDGEHGYFRPEDETAVIDRINERQTDLLIVGLGMPRQEEWLARVSSQLTAPVVLTSGAAMEYLAGASPTAPRWMGRIGLEWFHRLATNPRRFWRRYLVEPWFLVGLFVNQCLSRFRRRGRR